MKLSAIMPNYNQAPVLGNAIEAVMEQSRPPDELIIMDDGSTDGSVDILKKYAARHDAIKFYPHSENRGCVHVARDMMKLVSGDYFVPLASDDFILPGCLETGMDVLEHNPHAGMCFGDFFTYDEASERLERTTTGWVDNPTYLSGMEYAEGIKGDLVPGHVAIISVKALAEVGGWRDDLKWHCDWFTLLVMAFRYGVCYVPEPFGVRRRHSDSYSAKGRNDWTQQEPILRRVLELLNSDEYRDVLPHFTYSCAMSFFNRELPKLFMMDPSLWTPENIALCMPVLHHRVMECRQHLQDIWDQRLDDVETPYSELIDHRLRQRTYGTL